MDVGFSFWTDIGPPLLRTIPELVGWGIGIALVVIMLRRGGGRVEKMLLIGCCLLFIMQFFNPFINQIFRWLRNMDNMTAQTYGLIRTIYSVVLGIPGFVLLVWAFWIKFRVKKPEAV